MARQVGRRVVIVGGGPAGAATAISLAGAGFTPVVLEAQAGPQLKIGESLPPSASPLLDRLGLLEAVGRTGLPAHRQRFCWGSPALAERDFVFGTAGVGWQLDRRRFEQELSLAAIRSGTDWRYGQKVVRCSRAEDGGYALTVRTEREEQVVRADFVVDASGRPARLAHLLGERRIRYDRLVGFAAYVHREASEGGGAGDASTLVEAVAGGWWYSARLPGDTVVAAYLTDADLLSARPRLPGEGWGALLQSAPHTRERLGGGARAAAAVPRVLGAQTSRLSAVTGAGWLAVGDAAVAHDPLASYGITAALGSGLHAGAAVADYLGGRRDALRDYARLLDGAFARYLILHHDRYLAEGRWPDSTFWRRRHRPVYV